jgi:hypothetical protein
MDPRERLDDSQDAIHTAISGVLAGLWTALPCIVDTVNLGAKTITAQPAIKAFIDQADGSTKAVTMPLLLDVPIVYQRGGGGTLTFPVAPGDECLVIFASRAIDVWWQSGGVQVPNEGRRHDLSDGFALVGPFSQATNIGAISSSEVQLRSNDGQAVIGLSPGSHAVRMNGTTARVTGTASATLDSTGTASVTGGVSATLSATGPATVKSTSVSNVTGTFVMLGQGGLGNLADLPSDAEALFTTVMSGASIMENPVAGALGTITTSLTDGTISTGLAGLVTSGTITLADQTAIMAALTGPASLQTAVTALGGHTNLLAGIADPLANVPALGSVIGIAGGLNNVGGGAFGSTDTILAGMTTALGSTPTVAAANTYINSIVGDLSAGSTSVASVLSSVSTQTGSLNDFVSVDTSSFLGAQTQIKRASSFLTSVGQANNPTSAVQTLMAKVTPPATLATLRTLGS